MGSLAQRYADAARSGVYRVGAADVPRTAAGEAGTRLLEVSAAALADGGWIRLQEQLAGAQSGMVVLVEGARELATRRESAYLALVNALYAVASQSRQTGKPFFAVLLDAEQALQLPSLYKERL
jgi:hypothetical protein